MEQSAIATHQEEFLMHSDDDDGCYNALINDDLCEPDGARRQPSSIAAVAGPRSRTTIAEPRVALVHPNKARSSHAGPGH